MSVNPWNRRASARLLFFSVTLALAGCGDKPPPGDQAAVADPAATSVAPAPEATAPEVTPGVATVASDTTPASWTPEALEDLLAPVALYPDPVLSQVLIASTNPQEVLDAGNWLIANEQLSGKALDDAAAQVGFTPPVRALVQFPQTIDLMCMELGWTTELGQAFVADQAGVLDAVQRLRHQARDVGNLQSSGAMKVETQVQEGKEVIVLKPPKPDVVHVPTYDPQQAYAPLPAATTPVVDKTKYDTGDLVMTGVLAFGAGILVNELFDDDDHHRHDYYYPNYGYGGMPYYPPYPYRPVYGGGYYPSNGYNRPPNWNGGFQNNGNIIINTGNNGYWNRYPNRPGPGGVIGPQPRKVSSPISAARPNRPELQQLNQRQPRPMPANYQRPSPQATAANWKGQSTYKGKEKRPANVSRDPATRIAEAQPGYSRPSPGTGKAQQRPAPKVQGSYAGKQPGTRDVSKPKAPATRDVQRPSVPATRDVQRPTTAGARDVSRPQPAGDRGHGTRPTSQSRPSPQTGSATNRSAQNRGTAMGGAHRGAADKAASQRGRQSMPQGARQQGGGNNAKQKKQGR